MLENEKQFKTAMLAYLSSSEVATGDLRAYGRIIGVKSPTTKKNDELREEITAILLGELEPVQISKLGAPVKNDFVKPTMLKAIHQICEDYHIFDKYKKKQPIDDNMLPSIFPKVQDAKLVLEDASSLNDENVVYNGQLVYFNEVYYLFPLDCKNGQRILISEKIVEEYALREGDVVVCRARKGEKILVATEIISINGWVAKSFIRASFDEELPCYPDEPLKLDGVENKPSLKYVDWVMPIQKGQRACIVAPPKTGKSQMLYDLAVAAKNADSKTVVFALLIDQSPESVGKFRRAFSNDTLVYTTYEDDAQLHVFAADFLLRRAKRLVEHGVDVVLFVDSLSSLAKAYNDTDASMGGKTLAGGIESKTLQYLKRFFGAARKLEKGGSLTIVGSIASDTGNPADDLISGELSAISNFELRLSGELATKRIYPAIEPLQSKLGDEALMSKEESILFGKYLQKFGTEAFLNTIFESNTKETFFKTLQKSVEV